VDLTSAAAVGGQTAWQPASRAPARVGRAIPRGGLGSAGGLACGLQVW